MRIPRQIASALVISVAVSAVLFDVTPAFAQPGRPAFVAAGTNPAGRTRAVPAHRWREVGFDLDALNDDQVLLNLFDDLHVSARRTKVERQQPDRLVWHGRTDRGGHATFAVVRGVVTGSVYMDGRIFEIVPAGRNRYVVNELDTDAFPTEDPDGLAPVPQDFVPEAFDATGTASGAGTAGDGSATNEIDVLVVWTPRARNAVGGTVDAIESLVLAAVANANLAYENSGVNARLRLVHAREVSFTESTGSITGDLSALTTNGDGKLDEVHALRDQYGADVVTLLGSGYTSGGACGVGYLMQSVSTSFARYAFNVVDQSCAAGYLSYAHEVGHNQGLQHDPGNAGSAPSQPYAYGYQDPGNVFRTVLSYGGARRIPYFSSPLRTYEGRVTGTVTQDNARALNTSAPVVAAFKAAAGGSTPTPTPPPPSCSYSLSTTSLTFAAGGGSASIAVSTGADCAWTATSGSGWALVSGGGPGPASVVVTATPNTGGSRSTTLSVAGRSVTVSQQGVQKQKGNGGGKGNDGGSKGGGKGKDKNKDKDR